MSLQFIFIALAAVPLLVVFVVLRRRNRTAPDGRAAGIIYLAQTVGATAVGWGAIGALATVIAIFQPATGVHVTSTVLPFSPWSFDPFPSASGGDPYLMLANVEHVRLAVAQADFGTQMLQALGVILAALPLIVVGAFVERLCGRIISRSPFAPHLVRLSWVGAGVFLVAGFAGQLLSGLAAFRLATVAFEIVGSTPQATALPTPVWPAGLELWPLWGALALGVLAVLIRHGVSIQRDTEGLV